MYGRPEDLGQALELVASTRCAVVAGGTDYYPARVGRPIDTAVLDLTRVRALQGIEARHDGWRIGAATPWTAIVRADLPASLQALVQAAREVGGPQVQNRGTVGGNLCNASPAADGVVALLALDVEVELASVRGVRRLGLADFVLGPRRTALAADELMVAIHVPHGSPRARSGFSKLGHRRYLVISVAMVAVALDVGDDGCARRVGLAVGACGPVARRLPALEARLLGLACSELPHAAADALRADPQGMLAPLSPIDDVRGTADYRRDAVSTLLARVLSQVGA